MPFNKEDPREYNPKRDEDDIKYFNNVGLRLEQEYEGLDIEQDAECFILSFSNKKVFVQKRKDIMMSDRTEVKLEDYLRQIIEENGLKKKEQFLNNQLGKAA